MLWLLLLVLFLSPWSDVSPARAEEASLATQSPEIEMSLTPGGSQKGRDPQGKSRDMALLGAQEPTQAQVIPRFFRAGDGRIHIRNAHNGLQANVQLLNRDGSFSEEALNDIDKVFGFSPVENGEHISLRLLFLLDYFIDKLAAGKVLQLQSGYRAPEYNQSLRKMGRNVALTSAHMDAMAIDFFVDGVNGKFLWEMIRKEECCGVGHYGGKTIHLDSGRPRFWEAATSKVSSGESELNRRIYLSTQYDRYRAGEVVRLSLASISDFGFGVVQDIAIVGEDGRKDCAKLANTTAVDRQCVSISDRKAARSLHVTLPEHTPAGRYRLLVRFCNRPLPQMPAEVSSNVIEVVQ
jgi:uncharacterized protein YcbK (DUF882 family)